MKFTWEKCADAGTNNNVCKIEKNQIIRFGDRNVRKNWKYKIIDEENFVCDASNFSATTSNANKICETLQIENDASKKFNMKYLPTYNSCNGDFKNKPSINLKEEQYEFTGNVINNNDNCSKYNKNFVFKLESKDGVHILSNEPLDN